MLRNSTALDINEDKAHYIQLRREGLYVIQKLKDEREGRVNFTKIRRNEATRSGGKDRILFNFDLGQENDNQRQGTRQKECSQGKVGSPLDATQNTMVL